MFSGSFLSYVRRRALRRGVWFKALDGVERGILELSCRVVEEVRSLDLARVIVGILAKLRDASRSPYLRHVETFGVERAKALVEQAVSPSGAGLLKGGLKPGARARGGWRNRSGRTTLNPRRTP